MTGWAANARNAAVVGLGVSCALLVAAQLVAWSTTTLTTGFTYHAGAWMLSAPLAFSSAGLTFADGAWWDAAHAEAPRIWLLRLAGPALAVATIAGATAAAAAWRGRRRHAVMAAAVAAALTVVAVVLMALALPAFNGRLPSGRAVSSLGAGGFLAVAAAAGAGLGGAAAWRLPREAPRKKDSPASTEGSGWTPPPGFDPKTGLYVGDER